MESEGTFCPGKRKRWTMLLESYCRTARKNKKEYPLFDYEKDLFDTLLFSGVNNPANFKFKHKHLWVKKSTGLGVTEFMLRMMAWLCTSTEDKGLGIVKCAL